ncbi:MAG: class I SAM-dependent methyltransferase [Phycisphaerales bacterium]|nr:MAG: class I SAM-dependent methyltransferase [Phycisphaerales bacterium]
MRIMELINDPAPPKPWTQGDNIPWNDPDFSERMLHEHLSSEHDLASRRGEMIDRQVAWIHDHVLGTRSTRILDLCCGPGLYGTRLAGRGHEYVGIDYSPASIAHAKRDSAGNDRCKYLEGDVRLTDCGSGFGLVMMVYGEFNVFRPADGSTILHKIHGALEPGGLLLLEPHSRDAIMAIADAGRTWEALDAGLFSDRPHLYLQQAHWDDTSQAATRQFFVIDAATGDVARYAASYQAYSDDEYRSLLVEHGFQDVELHPSLMGDRDPTQTNLMAILARKSSG